MERPSQMSHLNSMYKTINNVNNHRGYYIRTHIGKGAAILKVNE